MGIMNAGNSIFGVSAIILVGISVGAAPAAAGATCAYGDGAYAENMAIAIDKDQTYFCNENGVWSSIENPGYTNRAFCIYAGDAYGFNSIIKVGNKTLKCKPGGWK